MKCLLFIMYLIVPVFAYSQVDYETYFVSAGQDKEELKIQVSEKKGAIDQVFIYAKSLDNIYSNTALIIDGKKLPVFIEYLNFISKKYIEWSDTAKSNNIESLTKDIDVDLKDYYMVAFASGDWYFDRRVKLNAKFAVEGGHSEVYLYTGKVYSSTNRYIDSKGLFIPFSNNEDLENFIKKLDIKKINSFLNENKGKENLFN